MGDLRAGQDEAAGLRVRPVTGGELEACLDQVAALRIEVFREFPYLYEGDLGYEREYLKNYAHSPGAVMVLVEDVGRVAGASTGLPLAAADPVFREPLESAGERVDDWFYLGESVLLPAYRGRGLGHRFFDERERRAFELGLQRLAFCAVERPDDHPARPEACRSLEPFWRARGYRPRDGWTATLAWRQVDTGTEVRNRLAFWTREAGDVGQM